MGEELMDGNGLSRSIQGELTVVADRTWSEDESACFDNALLDNAAFFAPHPTSKTDLTLAKVYRNDELIGVAPVTRLIKYRATRLLKAESRKWMDPIFGMFTQETTCMIDASFMAYRYADPFIARDPGNAQAVREAVISHLQGQPDVDNLLITEPLGDPSWASARGFITFLQPPLVRVDLDDCRNLDDYLTRLSQKRRRNFRNERKLFKQRGGSMTVLPPPHSAELLNNLHATLIASSAQDTGFEIPFGDLMNSRKAFEKQRQWVIVARDGGKIAGFFAFIPCGDIMWQCHGGLDYRYSLRLKTYQNLLHEAVCHAIEHGFRQVTFGPLNNEAKRRVGVLAPIMSAIWLRKTISRWMMKKVMLPRFQAYFGALG